MEITARDLRVGNLIFDHECEPHYFEVEQISKYVGSELWIIYRKGSIKTKTAEGIPLTEDWLKDFGFIYDGGEGWISPIGEHFYFSLRSGFIHKMYRDTKFVGVNFVHELQNLYYDLTKTELTLTK